MSEVASLFAKLGIDADYASFDKADKAIDETGKSLEETEKKAGGLSGALSKVGGVLSGMATVAVGVGAALAGAAGAAVQGFAAYGDEVAKSAVKLAVTGEELQRLRFAAGRSGVDVGSLTGAITKMNTGLTEAARTGKGPFADGLEMAGVAIEDLEGMNAESRIGLLADALQRIEDPTERAATAAKLFGKSAGIEMAPLLKEGSDGIIGLGEKAEELGLVMSGDTLKQAEALNDAISDVGLQAKAAGVRVGAQLAPAFTDMARGVSDWVAANDQFIEQDLPAIITAIGESVGWLATTLVEGYQEAKQLGREIGFLWDSGKELATGIGETLQPVLEGVTTALSDMFSGFTQGAQAIGTAIEMVLEYTGVLDILRDAWNKLPFMGESIDELTDRLHGGTTTKRGNASFLNPANEERRLREQAKGQQQLAAAMNAAAVTTALVMKYESTVGQGYGRRVPKKLKPGKGKGKGKKKVSVEVDEDDVDDLLDGVLSEDTDTVGRGLKPAKSGKKDEIEGLIKGAAGGGATAVAGASFVRVDASFNAPTTVNVNVAARRGESDVAAGQRIGEAAADAMTQRNNTAYDHYRQAVRP